MIKLKQLIPEIKIRPHSREPRVGDTYIVYTPTTTRPSHLMKLIGDKSDGFWETEVSALNGEDRGKSIILKSTVTIQLERGALKKI